MEISNNGLLQYKKRGRDGMLELEENKHKLISLNEKINSISEALNINAIEAEIEELEAKTSEPNFWDDQQNSSSVLTKMKRLQNKLAKMPEEAQIKLQDTLQRIVNEGTGGLICIIL